MTRLLLAIVGLMLSFAANSQQQTVSGTGYVVHYAAMAEHDLSAQVAQQLGITPRGDRALVILSPRREPAAAPLPATASGSVRRLTGQTQMLTWRPVDAGGQTDLIAEFEIPDGEHLVFDLNVRADGAPFPLEIHFQQQFYRD